MIQMGYNNIQSNAIIYNLNQQPSQDMSLLPQSPCIQAVKIEQNPVFPEDQGTIVPLGEVNRSRTWSRDELYRVAAFLHYNSGKFCSESSKKQFKVFKLMSRFVRTRNINQCRSYTNKLLKGFGDLENINAYFRESLPDYCRVVEQLKENNDDILLHHESLGESEDSIIRTQQSIDKSNTETLSHSRHEQSFPTECGSSGVIIPQVQKWTHGGTPFLLPFPLQQYPHNQEICQLFRRRCLELTLSFNLYAFLGNTPN